MRLCVNTRRAGRADGMLRVTSEQIQLLEGERTAPAHCPLDKVEVAEPATTWNGVRSMRHGGWLVL
jgi:hypothetical protein